MATNPTVIDAPETTTQSEFDVSRRVYSPTMPPYRGEDVGQSLARKLGVTVTVIPLTLVGLAEGEEK